MLMMALWVLRLFFILSLFSFVSCRPPSFEFLWRFTFHFHLVSLYFVFSWIFICPFSVGSFSGVFLLPFHSWARCVSISSCSFRLVRRGSRARSSEFCLSCSFAPWVRVALCALVMIPPLMLALSGLGMFLFVRPPLGLKMLLRRLPFPWVRVKRK